MWQFSAYLNPSPMDTYFTWRPQVVLGDFCAIQDLHPKAFLADQWEAVNKEIQSSVKRWDTFMNSPSYSHGTVQKKKKGTKNMFSL